MALTWGTTIGINPGAGQPGIVYSHWDRLIPDMKQAGLSRLRFQISWRNIELTPGIYNWAVLDDAVQHCNAYNIKIVYPIRDAPTVNLTQSATGAPDSFSLMDATAAAGFCQQLVNRYGPGSSIGVIDGYEIGNEDFNIHSTTPGQGSTATQDGGTYQGLYGIAGQPVVSATKWQPGRNPVFFESIAAACYPVLKATGKPVGMCSMWWIQPSNSGGVPNTLVSNYYAFLDRLFADGTLPQYADYLNFHYYSNRTDSTPSGGSHQVITYLQALTDIQSVVNKYSSSLKVRCTEFGWQANTNTQSNTQVTPGTRTIFVDNPSGATSNITMTVDTGANQETVTITSKSGNNLTGVFTKAHTGLYPVVIILDCDVATQQIRYQDVLQQSTTHSIVEGLDFFTLNYDFSNGSSLIINNGDGTYTYQPAYFTVQQFTGGAAASPITPPHAQGLVGSAGGGAGNQGSPLYGTDRPIYNMGQMVRRAPKRGGLLESIGRDIARLQGWIEDNM